MTLIFTVKDGIEGIGMRIKYAAMMKGISQATLASKVGSTQEHISHIVRGKYYPSLVTAIKIANELGVSLDWLAGVNEKEEKK